MPVVAAHSYNVVTSGPTPSMMLRVNSIWRPADCHSTGYIAASNSSDNATADWAPPVPTNPIPPRAPIVVPMMGAAAHVTATSKSLLVVIPFLRYHTT